MCKYLLFLITFSFFVLTSCQKEINIDLNSSNPKFVIEGQLSDASIDSTLVYISKTLNFNQAIAYPLVNDAIVTITDDTNNTNYTLSLLRPGVYFIPNLVGITGHQYTLKVGIGTQFFSSSSIMPSRVNLVSILLFPTNSGGSGNGPPGSKPRVALIPNFTDIKDVVNYYQIVASRNDTILYNIDLRDDLIFNGLPNKRPVILEGGINDHITFDLQCIDKSVYDYFFGLDGNLRQSSATPSNPPSTFTNGALGYFKVHSSSKFTYIIQ